MRSQDVEIVERSMKRTGAIRQIESVYVRDPYGNLVEVGNYLNIEYDIYDSPQLQNLLLIG
jgi:hypothetical protein